MIVSHVPPAICEVTVSVTPLVLALLVQVPAMLAGQGGRAESVALTKAVTAMARIESLTKRDIAISFGSVSVFSR
jgi:hypothetical protein